MKLRAQPLPKTLGESATTLFLAFMIPLTYYFELWIVGPGLMPINSAFYTFNFVLGTFILLNVVSNMMALMLCNTSIIGEKIVRPSIGNTNLWKFCSACETITPPRSWHCSTCKVCILKRDHHCAFTGCCVGHHNQRYFISLILYLFIGTAYASVLNSIFIWSIHGDEYRGWITIVKLIFPFAMLMYETSIFQYYLIMYILLVIGAVFTGFLLIYHLRNMWHGVLTHEALRQFDLGPLENIRMIFGVRWYLAWISPFIQSELPFDGIDWQKIYEKTAKNL